MADQITDFLDDKGLDFLRQKYDRGRMTQILSATLPAVYAPVGPYIDAIRNEFYSVIQPGTAAPTTAMSPLDRERCLIAILCTRGPFFALALHMYVGLMEGLQPDDIGNIVFLSSIYTGIDNLSEGLGTAMSVLGVLSDLVGQFQKPGMLQAGKDLGTPDDIVKRLKQLFPR
jgi:hypothetical protein